MRITYTPGEYKPISLSAERGKPHAMTIEDALKLYDQLGRAILDAIKDRAQEARL